MQRRLVYFTYDSSGRCTSSSGDGNDHYTNLTFDPANNRTMVTDSKNKQAIYYYNADSLITKVENPQGGQVASVWDNNLNLVSRSDELGRLTQMQYDSMGNVVKVTDALAKLPR